MSAACCVGAAVADAPRVLRAGGVAISCCCRRCCCCCCCWPLGCCHVYKHLHTYIHALLSFSHCPSGAQGGGPLALCYGSLHYYRCLLTAARKARGARRHHAHLDATAITTSPSHHLHAKVCLHLHTPRLICPVLSLPVRGLEHEDDDEAVAGSSDVGPGCVTSVPRHAR